jgi:parallel beta-helix repeat protein
MRCCFGGLGLCLGILVLAGSVWGSTPLPEVRVTSDDTVITRSCRIVIPVGTRIPDLNTNGVIQVAADNITIEFASESRLLGAPDLASGDAVRGIGIRIDGHRGVTVRGARVQGFFNGLVATRADDLLLDGGDYSGNYRQRLRSTPRSEDASDWLFPHHNDQTPWREQYGGAVCVERSSSVTIRNVTVRRGQNGIVLDRVDDSRIYDNDASFLSGWGLAMWRSSRNVVSRNAFDFCVRGHSEGVYNRGQDSAGILCFEQCNDNVFAENSVTHGGDGFFGFAGREALGEVWMDQERARLRRETGREQVDDLIRYPATLAHDFSVRGCNRNLLVDNDFSYSPAHGVEMTFSEGNVLVRNRIVENGICGFWGGYSSDTLIAANEFTGNGALAYGLERGGINMEHGSHNRILGNRFLDNKAAIHLWWDDDGALFRLPGVAGNLRGVEGNVIADNSFRIEARHQHGMAASTDRWIILQLRDDGTHQIRENWYLRNSVHLGVTNAVEFAVKGGTEPPKTSGSVPSWKLPRYPVYGSKHPVGARKHLRGRGKILLDEWGPWDHEGPWIRALGTDQGSPAWEVFHAGRFEARLTGSGATLKRRPGSESQSEVVSILAGAGVTPYRLTVHGDRLDRAFEGRILRIPWEVSFFSWRQGPDPRTNLAAWRALASAPEAVQVRLESLQFPYGGRGPKDLKLSEELSRRGPGGERFGMIARATVPLPVGRWKVVTRSDDGVRVQVNGTVVLENWTWHGPERDEAAFETSESGSVELIVEHFEIDGHSEFSLDLEP